MDKADRPPADLTAAQWDALTKLDKLLPLICDLAHAQLTVYARAAAAGRVVILRRYNPHTGFSLYQSDRPGAAVAAAEEPLVWRALTTGEAIRGKREWAFGMLADMYTFPLHDFQGGQIGAITFETNAEDFPGGDYEYLLETAYLLLSGARPPLDARTYRPLSAGDGIALLNERGEVVFANAAAAGIYKVLGIRRIVGRHMYERQPTLRIIKKAVTARKPCENELESGGLKLVQRCIPVIVKGQVVRAVIVIADVTELKKKEKELLVKSAVIQEIHHRVKNSLQAIAGLLRLQARRTDSAAVKAALKESVNRILSISTVHEFLSQQGGEKIDIAAVAKDILDTVTRNMLAPGFRLRTALSGETAFLPPEKAGSLALVMNELVQNAVEHGFSGRMSGVIGVHIAVGPDDYSIDIYDDGNGLPDGFEPRTSKRLGLQIVRTLVEEDLEGRFTLRSGPETRASIRIPRRPEGA